MIVSITTTIPSLRNPGAHVWYIVDFPQYSEISDLFDAICADGLCCGTRLRVDHIGKGTSRILSEEPIVLGRGANGTITPCHIRFEAEPPLDDPDFDEVADA